MGTPDENTSILTYGLLKMKTENDENIKYYNKLKLIICL